MQKQVKIVVGRNASVLLYWLVNVSLSMTMDLLVSVLERASLSVLFPTAGKKTSS
ncbi:MAG: hypothetical protein WC136_05500 [Sphaerochaeta sp.]